MGERSASLIYVRPIVCPVSAVFVLKNAADLSCFPAHTEKGWYRE